MPPKRRFGVGASQRDGVQQKLANAARRRLATPSSPGQPSAMGAAKRSFGQARANAARLGGLGLGGSEAVRFSNKGPGNNNGNSPGLQSAQNAVNAAKVVTANGTVSPTQAALDKIKASTAKK